MDIEKYIEECQLVVHAGGRGERWSTVTNGHIVKPRTDVGKNPRPMIDWSMLPFVKAGVKNVFPSMWFKADTLKSHMDEVARQTDLKFTYMTEPEDRRLGRAGIIKESIKNGMLDSKKPIISINGSDVISIDVKELIRFHLEGLEKNCGVTIVGATEMPTEFGLYKVDPVTMKVSGFKEKPVVKISDEECVHTGMFVFDPVAVSAFTDIDESSYPVNIEDLKGRASESVFSNARSYRAVVPLSQWVFFKSPKHFKQFGGIDFEEFLNVEDAEKYLGKYSPSE